MIEGRKKKVKKATDDYSEGGEDAEAPAEGMDGETGDW